MEHQKLLVFNPRVVKYFLEGRVLKGKFDPHTCIVFLNFLNYEQVWVVRKIYETFTLNVIKKKKKKEKVRIDIFFLKNDGHSIFNPADSKIKICLQF